MDYILPIVSDSEHLTSKENKLISDLYTLCSSVAENEVDSPKKTHIRESILNLEQKLLAKKVQVRKSV